jgi:dihydrofolate synthase/folylpolyglutamate synthase
MVPTINAMQSGEWGAPSFFEILIALSYKLFAEAGVDVVVMETGLGGRYDATNTVTGADKIALFTDIDYDHVELLGSTLAKIAGQKAGIIQPHNRVLTYLQPPEAQEVIADESQTQEASLTIFDPAKAIHNIRLYPQHLLFDLTLPGEPPLTSLYLSLAGAHQAHNAGLAVAAAQLFLSGSGRRLDEGAIRHALAHINLPGRMEERQWRGVRFIIDGAHNAQKIHALCSALEALYPDERFIFVVALKEGKDHSAIFAQLLPLASHLILTRFENNDQGMVVNAVAPAELATLLPTGTEVPVTVMPTAAGALALAATMAQNAPIPVRVIVTGSLYLLAEVYEVIDPEGVPAP